MTQNETNADADIKDANASPLPQERGERVAVAPDPTPDLSAVRAIVFDLDDTLCGYWDASKAALRQAFEEHGPEGFGTEDLVREWATVFRQFAPTIKNSHWYAHYLRSGELTRTEQMRLTLESLGIQDQERAEILSRAYMEGRDRNLRLFEDAVAVLDKIKARYPLGLMTNGPADIQRQEIATLGVEHYFDHFFIEGEMGEGKPNLSVFQRAVDAFGVSPQEILMVGNSYGHDVKAALAAGWHAIWIRRPSDVPPSAHGDAKPEELPPGGPQPTAIIGDLSELLPLLRLA